ncbi:sugar-transfer associated ATP-grasp domain-containing protein [Longibacter salinarum]|nr:sugar-transfer associated ATP-grasp domain-containing protein [Longibacter salinarum]
MRLFKRLKDVASSTRDVVHPARWSAAGGNRSERNAESDRQHKHDKRMNENLLSKARLAENGLPVPTTYVRVASEKEIRDAWSTIQDLRSFVLKRVDGRGESKTLVLEREEMGTSTVWRSATGQVLTAQDVQRYMAHLVTGGSRDAEDGQVVVEYRVTVDDMFYQIYPRGLSYISVITYQGEPKFAMVVVPTDASKGRADIDQGALGVGVDIATGKMHPAYDSEGFLAEHPDTYSSIEGVRIWRWEQLLDLAKKTASALPFDYLSMDLVVDAHRGPLVMNVDSRPPVDVQGLSARGLHELLSEI